MPIRTEALMGTLVTLHVVRGGAEVDAAIECALGWFREIEARCTRFCESSELMQVVARTGEAVPVSTMLFQAVRFAVRMAEETGGAFDPSIGHRVASRGFNREHRTGAIVEPREADADATYRDIVLDENRQTVTLLRRMTLDLGAVAKGLAVDTAARELAPFRDFAIDAGGDLYLGGLNPQGAPWSVGIRHPRRENEVIERLQISNRAVCTSGDYERREPGGEGHHILDPRTGEPARSVASVTVIAPGAMLADALATAAFVLGPHEGTALLTHAGVEGLIVTPDLIRYETPGFRDAA